MPMAVSFEFFLLLASVLLFVSIFVGKTGYRFGIPALLLFLLVGILVGSDGVGIEFRSPHQAQYIGIIALNIILFSGGMDTRFSEIKPVILPGVILSIAGVLLTALITGVFIYWLTNNVIQTVTFSLIESLLLASIMSSTDSASVFSILRSKGLTLKQNLRPLLELESGSNDPMAYMLVILCIQLLQSTAIQPGKIIFSFFQQLIIGVLVGVILGRLAVYLINHIHLEYEGLYSALLVAVMLFLFGFSSVLGGNGYLAVYIGGLLIGNQRFVYKRSMMKFFDGLTWLFQIIMFLTLGLLVNPHELLPIAGVGILIGLFMILVSRPLSVFSLLLPFKKITFKGKLFVSWVGLRGAVPIIFATYPWISGVEQAETMFNIVFFITILSLLLQGTSVPLMARWLGLAVQNNSERKPQLKEFDIDLSDEINSAIAEIVITEEMLKNGNRLSDLALPDKVLVTMIKRSGEYLVPRGNTSLEVGDIVLLIADNEQALMETYRQLGL
ncbi:potassium/proton antiporter [Anaerorudis cellulosivorans]|uniref:potassium/proton antiporter n=1 Tax=Anaerorudis cellulosivorans TaxID=3397862 RepID=UPI0039B6F2E0